MKRKKEIKDLLTSIKKTIKNVTANTISSTQAEEEYKKLLAAYQGLLGSISQEPMEEFIGGILYYNNSENYSKLTVLFELDSGSPRHISSYGDHELIQAAADSILIKSQNAEMGRIYSFKLDMNNEDKNVVYVYPFNKGMKIAWIAAVSSSQFFSKDSFLTICTLVHGLYSDFIEQKQPVFVSHSGEIARRISEYLDKNPYVSLVADLYHFPGLDTELSQTGSASLRIISGYLVSTLSGEYGEDALVIPLSFPLYLAIADMAVSPIMIDDTKEIKFEYAGSPMQSKRKRININDEASRKEFLQKVHYHEFFAGLF